MSSSNPSNSSTTIVGGTLVCSHGVPAGGYCLTCHQQQQTQQYQYWYNQSASNINIVTAQIAQKEPTPEDDFKKWAHQTRVNRRRKIIQGIAWGLFSLLMLPPVIMAYWILWEPIPGVLVRILSTIMLTGLLLGVPAVLICKDSPWEWKCWDKNE